MKIHHIIFEGTASEYRSIHDLLENASVKVQSPSDSVSSLSKELALRVIRYKPLSENQKKIFRVLLRYEQEGIEYDKFLTELKMEGKELGGILGGFGRRIMRAIPGTRLSVYDDFIEYRHERDNYIYKISNTFGEALREEGFQ